MRGTVALLIWGLLSSALPAEVTVGGFMASEFVKGQKQAAWTEGTFGRPMLGLSLYGEAQGRVTFFGQGFYTQDEELQLTDAWVRVAVADYLLVRAGLFPVPFGQYNENSLPHQSRLAVRPLHAQYLFPELWRDVGIMAEGRWSGLTYSAWLSNGTFEGESLADGQQFRDNNADKAWGVRAGLDLGQGTELAYSVSRSRPDSDAGRALFMQAINLNWRTAEIEVLAEYTRSRFESPPPYDEAAGDGFLIQAIVNFGFAVPVLSYQKVNYSDGFRGPGFAGASTPGAGIDLERTRLTVGALFPLTTGIDLKLEYDLNREPDPTIDDNLLTVQLAARF